MCCLELVPAGSVVNRSWLGARQDSRGARRRFVTRLIREGEVGFEEACRLLRQLPASGEHWGVSAILERYPLKP